MYTIFRLALLVIAAFSISGCLGIPKGVEPISNFQPDRYLGTWYEIARLDHSFERGLSKVTANYSWREDGGVRVINRGYSEEEQTWEEAEGKAYFVEKDDQGYLKVSFFGPFYASYVIFELDERYQHAFVTGPSTEYLWLLSRTQEADSVLIDRFKQKATELGFDTKELIFVEH